MAVAVQSGLMPMGVRMPTNQTPVRYAHVAHFVGLSLLRDPNLARRDRQVNGKSASTPHLSQKFDEFAVQQPSLSVGDSLPSLSTERVDQLRCQVNWLKAERRAESEQLKKLEHVLSDSMRAEQVARERAKQQRQRRDAHQQQLTSLSKTMQAVKTESRSRLASDMASTWSGAGGSSPGNKAAALIANASSVSPMHSSPVSPKSTSRPNSPPDDKSRELVVKEEAAGKLAKQSKPRPMKIDLEMFDSEEALSKYRKDVVRKDLLTKVERRVDPTGELLGGRAVNFYELKLGLISERLTESEILRVWEMLEPVEAPSPLEAFKLINLNGSGRCCANDFADGISRCGCPWQKLTGLRKGKDLFRLFDTDHDGVVTFFELFPSERNVKKKDTGTTTPEFWKTYTAKNRAESFFNPKGRSPPWNTGVADDSLAIKNDREGKDADAKFMRKWMQTTMRRLKGRGKSDARVREMCCTHLPKGTGPKDRQEVATFSDVEVKQCRREYNDAVLEPQRTVLKALYDLRETRKELSSSRQKLWHVAMEPHLKQQAMEAQANVAKSALGGLFPHQPHEAEAEKESTPHHHRQTVSADFGDALHSLTPFH